MLTIIVSGTVLCIKMYEGVTLYLFFLICICSTFFLFYSSAPTLMPTCWLIWLISVAWWQPKPSPLLSNMLTWSLLPHTNPSEEFGKNERERETCCCVVTQKEAAGLTGSVTVQQVSLSAWELEVTFVIPPQTRQVSTQSWGHFKVLKKETLLSCTK